MKHIKVKIFLIMLTFSFSAYSDLHSKIMGEYKINIEKQKQDPNFKKRLKRDPDEINELKSISMVITKNIIKIIHSEDGEEMAIKYKIFKKKDNVLHLEATLEGKDEINLLVKVIDDKNIMLVPAKGERDDDEPMFMLKVNQSKNPQTKPDSPKKEEKKAGSRLLHEFKQIIDGDGPECIAYNPKNKSLLIGANSTLNSTDTKGKILGKIKTLSAKTKGLSVDASGLIYTLCSITATVYVIDGKGKEQSRIKLPPSSDYRALSVSADGKKFIISARTAVFNFDVKGNKMTKTRITGTDIQGVAHTKDGNIWTVDDETLKLQLFNSEGKLLHSLNLNEITDSEDPEGLALDEKSGVIYVAYDRKKKIAAIDISSLK